MGDSACILIRIVITINMHWLRQYKGSFFFNSNRGVLAYNFSILFYASSKMYYKLRHSREFSKRDAELELLCYLGLWLVGIISALY